MSMGHRKTLRELNVMYVFDHVSVTVTVKVKTIVTVDLTVIASVNLSKIC
jgi:hypothetical protein